MVDAKYRSCVSGSASAARALSSVDQVVAANVETPLAAKNMGSAD